MAKTTLVDGNISMMKVQLEQWLSVRVGRGKWEMDREEGNNNVATPDTDTGHQNTEHYGDTLPSLVHTLVEY